MTEHPHSASFQKFSNRLQTTLQHLNVVNKALEEVSQSQLPTRSIAKHAITRNEELAFQLLYTHLNEYLRLIVGEMYLKRPLEVVNKAQGSLKFHQIIKLGSYEAICEHMIRQVFRSLDNQRGTKSLIENILDKTGFVADVNILEKAMFYMEIRHLIVHNSSMVDDKFEELYGSKVAYAKSGNRVQMSIGFTRKAIKSIRDLCKNIDQGLIGAGYLDRYTIISIPSN